MTKFKRTNIRFGASIYSNWIFLPIGNDSSAWVYRVETDKKHYFLKIRKGIPQPAIINASHYLKHEVIYTGNLYALV